MARASELLGDRWVLLILREAFYGVRRFEDVRADIDAPRAVLSQRLARLVEAGLLDKRPYRDPGDRQRFEYVLTDKGKALGHVLIALMEWGDAHLRDDPKPLDFVDETSGKPLHIALVTPDGEERPLSAARAARAAPRRPRD